MKAGLKGGAGGQSFYPLPRGTLRPDRERLLELETDQKIVPSKELCYLPPQPGRRKPQGRQNRWKLRPVLHTGQGLPSPTVLQGPPAKFRSSERSAEGRAPARAKLDPEGRWLCHCEDTDCK